MQNIRRLLLKAIKFSAIRNNSYVSRNLNLQKTGEILQNKLFSIKQYIQFKRKILQLSNGDIQKTGCHFILYHRENQNIFTIPDIYLLDAYTCRCMLLLKLR